MQVPSHSTQEGLTDASIGMTVVAQYAGTATDTSMSHRRHHQATRMQRIIHTTINHTEKEEGGEQEMF